MEFIIYAFCVLLGVFVGAIVMYFFLKKEHQKQIIEAMTAEVMKDRSRIDIKGYTELNLVELTRKRMNI